MMLLDDQKAFKAFEDTDLVKQVGKRMCIARKDSEVICSKSSVYGPLAAVKME